MTNIAVRPTQTTAFYVQSAISFGTSVAGVLIGTAFLPVNGWIRAFLGLGVLYAVTSTFTLAKVVRDQQERQTVIHRVDEARLEQFIAEHDPFSTKA